MGCGKSKSKRQAEEPGEPLASGSELDHDRQQSLELPLGSHAAEPESLPAKTPMAPKDDSMVTFDKASHVQIDTLLPGEARAKAALQWQGSCFSSSAVSASSSRRGVAFKVEPSFVAVGLKATAGKADDTYGALDYSFYCMQHGRLQIYEAGEMKYTHKPKYTEDSVLEIHLRAHPHAVEYLIDEQVVYRSGSKPPDVLHFQICFGDHPAAVSDACYVMTSK